MKASPKHSCLHTLLALAAPFLAPAALHAGITWDPAASSHDGTGGGFTLVSGPGVPAGTGMTNNGAGTKAYGGGNNSYGIFAFSFINTTLRTGAISETELDSTPLLAGTTLTLYFDKASEDRINYLAIVGDPDATVTYQVLSDTRIKVVAKVVNPVQSASGDLNAVFGMIVDYQNLPSVDFKQTLFITNMHYFDVDPPVTRPAGAAGLNANGVNGVLTKFRAYLPISFLNAVGLTDPAQCEGYLDGIETPPGTFTNEGLDLPQGWDFMDATNPTNQVLKVEIENSVWSPHDVQFGKILSDPNAALRALLTQQIAVAKKKLRAAKTPALKKKWRKKIRSLNARLAALG